MRTPRFIRSISVLLGLAAPFAGAEERYHVLAGDIAPFSYEDEHGPTGLAVEILCTLAKREHIRFDIDVMSWKRAQTLAQLGGKVLIIPLTRTPEREQLYRWVSPLFTYRYVFATTSRPSPQTLKQASTMSVVTLKSNAVAPQLPQLGFTTVGFSDTEEINAKRLHNGLADAWLAADLLIPFSYRRAGFDPAELTISKFEIGNHWEVNLAASKDFPAADAARLDAALDRLRGQGVIDGIVSAYRSGNLPQRTSCSS